MEVHYQFESPPNGQGGSIHAESLQVLFLITMDQFNNQKRPHGPIDNTADTQDMVTTVLAEQKSIKYK